MFKRSFAAACSMVVAGLLQQANAGITTDGSLGARQSFTSPNVLLPASLGKQKGGNVFQSFGDFSIPAGGKVTFTANGATAPVKNVLARVTGGQVSQINGQLGCNIPDANLYLINPAGLTFGRGSSLSVSGTFTATTADVVKLADRKAFAADQVGDGVLTGATPAAFGLLSAKAGAITLDHTTLTAPSTSLVGGKVIINAATVSSAPGTGSSVTVSAHALMLMNGGEISSATFGTDQGGNVSVKAGTLSIDGSGRSNVATGIISRAEVCTGSSGDVSVRADRLSMNGGEIGSATFDAGRAGDVSVKAGTLSIDGGARSNFAGISSSVQDGVSPAGDVFVDAGTLTLRNGGIISSDSFGLGLAGSVRINANKFVVDGSDSLTYTGVASSTGFRGGDIAIHASTLSIANGGEISSLASAFVPGIAPKAGNMAVKVQFLNIVGAGDNADNYTRIGSTADQSSEGTAGDVSILAERIAIVNGAAINSGTSALSKAESAILKTLKQNMTNATGAKEKNSSNSTISMPARRKMSGANSLEGTAPTHVVNVSVTAPSIIIDGKGNRRAFTGISSQAVADSATPAGAIAVHADTLLLFDGGEISSGTFGKGAAGSVSVRTVSAILDGSGSERRFTGINSQANSGSVATAGDVRVSAEKLAVDNAAAISSINLGTGTGGSVTLIGRDLSLGQGSKITASSEASAAGNVVIRMADEIYADGETALAQISANSLAGNGGSIFLNAGRLISLTNTSVTAHATTNGLQLHMDPLIVVLNRTTIDAEAGSLSKGFSPVKLTIDPTAILIKSLDSHIFNDSPVLPPDVDLTGAIVDFVVPNFGLQTALAAGCEEQSRKRNLSSFTAHERLGIPPIAGAAVSSPPAFDSRPAK